MTETYYRTGEVFQRPHTSTEVMGGIGHFFRLSWRKANFVYINLFIFFIYLFSSLGTFNWNLMTNILYSSVTVGIVALGMGLIILTGEIDLSVGSIFAFVAGIAVLTYNDVLAKTGNAVQGLLLTLLVSLALGAFLGFINGFFIGKVKMPSFIVTLATMLILRSLIQYILSSLPGKPSLFRVDKYGTGSDPFFTLGNFQVGQISLVGILFIVIALLVWFMSVYTKYGRKIYAVGSNAKAASLVGISTGWLKASIFTLAGALVGFGAFLQLGIRGNVDPATTGKSYELYSIAAVVLGEVSMSGGSGNLIGIIFGTLAFQTIDKIIAALKLNAFLNDTIKGVILIIAVLIQVLKVSKEDVHKLLEKAGICYEPNKDLILDAKMKNEVAKVTKQYQKKIDAVNGSKTLAEEEIIRKINALLDERDAKIQVIQKTYEHKIDEAKLAIALHDEKEKQNQKTLTLRKEEANQAQFDHYLLAGGKGTIASYEQEEKILTEEEDDRYAKEKEILSLRKDHSLEKDQAEYRKQRDQDLEAYQSAIAKIDEEANQDLEDEKKLEEDHQARRKAISEKIAEKKTKGIKPGISGKALKKKETVSPAEEAKPLEETESEQTRKKKARLEKILEERKAKK
jgi:ribose transport system permease protein